MDKRKQSGDAATPIQGAEQPTSWDSQIFASNAPLHDLFQKQVLEVLEQSDMDEQAKQAILVALNCPCCGAGAMNYTAKVNRKPK
ncbi:MAG: hypothetical protein FJX62_04315 [Alphaproteobacteria bacterium]|nr:hypothetical protein [Alphaproteobacteria bacterium]